MDTQIERIQAIASILRQARRENRKVTQRSLTVELGCSILAVNAAILALRFAGLVDTSNSRGTYWVGTEVEDANS